MQAAYYSHDVQPPAFCSSELDCSRMKLQSAVFACFIGSEVEVFLIKFLLECAPLLKKMSIGLDAYSMVDGKDGKFKFAKKLLKIHRASRVVEIDLY